MNSNNLVYLPLSSTNYDFADNWFSEKRNYDILINNWGSEPDFFRDRHPELYFEIKEHKFRTLMTLYSTEFKALEKYDYIMCPDPDLKISVENVNSLFSIAKQYNLDLCAPSCVGYLNHEFLYPIPNKNALIRHLNFIEPMCPMFSRRGMYSCLWTFSLSYSAWGLDFVWPHLIANEKKNNFGVINTISIEHTRPCVSKDVIFENGKRAWNEHEETLGIFGLTKEYKTYGITPKFSIKSNLMM